MKTHYITKAKWDKAIAAPSPMALTKVGLR